MSNLLLNNILIFFVHYDFLGIVTIYGYYFPLIELRGHRSVVLEKVLVVLFLKGIKVGLQRNLQKSRYLFSLFEHSLNFFF